MMAKKILEGPALKVARSLAPALDADNAQLVRTRLGKLRGMLGRNFSEYKPQILKELTKNQAARLRRITSFR